MSRQTSLSLPLALSSLLCGALTLAAPGCAPGVPDNPTWAEDVAPILAANCARCHTVPAIFGAPDSIRLDTFEDWTADDGRVYRGAGTLARYIVSRIKPSSGSGVDRMPPEDGFAELSDRQIEIIEKWARTVSLPDIPRPEIGSISANEAPTMEILSNQESAGVRTIEYQIRDGDRDVVVGSFEIRTGSQAVATVTGELHSGRGQLTWDTRTLASGIYDLVAVLRDTGDEGNLTEINLGEQAIDNPNPAPVVTVLSPRRDTLVANLAGAPFDIQLMVTGDVTGVEIELRTFRVRDRGEGRPAAFATITPTEGINTVPWDLTAVAASDSQLLEVTVKRGTETVGVIEVGDFIVAKGATTEKFGAIADGRNEPGSIGELLANNCAYCHPGDSIFGLDHNFSRYGVTDGALGAGDLAGLIYRRAIQYRNMPPVSSEATLDETSYNRLREWLLAGAPEQ